MNTFCSMSQLKIGGQTQCQGSLTYTRSWGTSSNSNAHEVQFSLMKLHLPLQMIFDWNMKWPCTEINMTTTECPGEECLETFLIVLSHSPICKHI